MAGGVHVSRGAPGLRSPCTPRGTAGTLAVPSWRGLPGAGSPIARNRPFLMFPAHTDRMFARCPCAQPRAAVPSPPARCTRIGLDVGWGGGVDAGILYRTDS